LALALLAARAAAGFLMPAATSYNSHERWTPEVVRKYWAQYMYV